MKDVLKGEITMKRMKLVSPAPEYKDLIMAYKREFIENEDSMDGTAGLSRAETFDDWYDLILDNACEETVRESLLPARTYLGNSISDGSLIGMIDIRHRFNDFLFHYVRHIGYRDRNSEMHQGMQLVC